MFLEVILNYLFMARYTKKGFSSANLDHNKTKKAHNILNIFMVVVNIHETCKNNFIYTTEKYRHQPKAFW